MYKHVSADTCIYFIIEFGTESVIYRHSCYLTVDTVLSLACGAVFLCPWMAQVLSALWNRRRGHH